MDNSSRSLGRDITNFGNTTFPTFPTLNGLSLPHLEPSHPTTPLPSAYLQLHPLPYLPIPQPVPIPTIPTPPTHLSTIAQPCSNTAGFRHAAPNKRRRTTPTNQTHDTSKRPKTSTSRLTYIPPGPSAPSASSMPPVPHAPPVPPAPCGVGPTMGDSTIPSTLREAHRALGSALHEESDDKTAATDVWWFMRPHQSNQRPTEDVPDPKILSGKPNCPGVSC